LRPKTCFSPNQFDVLFTADREKFGGQDATSTEKQFVAFRRGGSFHISARRIAGGEQPIGLAKPDKDTVLKASDIKHKGFPGIGLFSWADGSPAQSEIRWHPFLR